MNTATLKEILADDGHYDLRRDEVEFAFTGAFGAEIDDTGEELDMVAQGERRRRQQSARTIARNIARRTIPSSVVREIYTSEHPYTLGVARGVDCSMVRHILLGSTYSDITESLTRWGRK